MVADLMVYSTLRLFPLGAGAILGVYVTVLVTTSLICRTLVREVFCFFSIKRALRAASQSNTEWTGLALKGDRTVLALIGESMLDTLGLGGTLRLGKQAGPVGGADMGVGQTKGLGGIIGAVAGGVGRAEALEVMLEAEDGGVPSRLQEASVSSLVAVSGSESGVVRPELVAGELRAMALVRKSVYAIGGLIGVLRKSGSGLNVNETAEIGVADVISEGKVAVTGVVSFPNLGLAVGMMMVELTVNIEVNVDYGRVGKFELG